MDDFPWGKSLLTLGAEVLEGSNEGCLAEMEIRFPPSTANEDREEDNKSSVLSSSSSKLYVNNNNSYNSSSININNSFNLIDPGDVLDDVLLEKSTYDDSNSSNKFYAGNRSSSSSCFDLHSNNSEFNVSYNLDTRLESTPTPSSFQLVPLTGELSESPCQPVTHSLLPTHPSTPKSSTPTPDVSNKRRTSSHSSNISRASTPSKRANLSSKSMRSPNSLSFLLSDIPTSPASCSTHSSSGDSNFYTTRSNFVNSNQLSNNFNDDNGGGGSSEVSVTSSLVNDVNNVSTSLPSSANLLASGRKSNGALGNSDSNSSAKLASLNSVFPSSPNKSVADSRLMASPKSRNNSTSKSQDEKSRSEERTIFNNGPASIKNNLLLTKTSPVVKCVKLDNYVFKDS